VPEKLYKVLKRNDRGQLVSCNGGSQVWVPGKKVYAHDKGPLVPCENGIHVCREQDLIHWLNEVICPVLEASEERVVCDYKVVLRWAVVGDPLPTWNECSARLFACDCMEWELSLLDKPDARSVEMVRVSRLFAVGEATRDELDAAWAAAWAAARDAAWAAARDAATAAARDAAWAAARDAATAAARDAAWAAARDAAWDADWDAAWDAARAYMTERLMEYLKGDGEPA
jgi:hypothetical protein